MFQHPFTVSASTMGDTTGIAPLTLGTDSTLEALPLHWAHLELQALGGQAADLFNQFPELPGLMLTDQDAVVGVLSRSRFLEFLLRPKGCELFLAEPLSVVYSYARIQPLAFTVDTLILTAARTVLRRPTNLQSEPIVVRTAEGDRLLNAHDLNQAHWQIRGIETQVRHERTQAAMLQTHKMAALGRLVDGIAHEIMDPLGFIWGNLTHVDQYCQQLLKLIAAYEQSAEANAGSPVLSALEDEIELDYLKQDLPAALNSAKGGAARLKQLASSLQNFCHIDDVYPKPADLHGLIDSIVVLLKSRLATQIHIHRCYESLPPVPCFAGHLSQVLMNVFTYCIDNLLSLAAHQSHTADFSASPRAHAAPEPPVPPQITISTTLRDAATTAAISDRWVVITVTDNGPALSAEEYHQILDSFSVQQRLEQETDLAASYRSITAKHGGTFTVRSPAPNRATDAGAIGIEFEIQLPLYRFAQS